MLKVIAPDDAHQQAQPLDNANIANNPLAPDAHTTSDGVGNTGQRVAGQACPSVINRPFAALWLPRELAVTIGGFYNKQNRCAQFNASSTHDPNYN